MRPILLALLLIAGNLPASAQSFDGAIDRRLPMLRYDCDGQRCFIVPKPRIYDPSLQPINRRDYWRHPDWRHPPAHCYGQPWDVPECRGEFG